MAFGFLNTAIMRGGLSVVAALLLTSAVYAQDVAVDEGSTDDVVVQTWHVLNPGDLEGLAVGEPEPTSGDGTDPVVITDPVVGDDGTPVDIQNWFDLNPDGDDTVGEDGATDPAATDDGGDAPTDDGSDPLTDDGTVVIYYMDAGAGGCIDCNVASGGILSHGRPTNPSEVERTRTVPTVKRHSSAAMLPATMSMAQCLILHPRSAWICEWQNGAGQ